MAYLKDITKACNYPGCKTPATHQLTNRFNAPVAHYCKKHGEQRLKLANREEEKEEVRRG